MRLPFTKYPVNVTIFENRNGAFVMMRDKARRIFKRTGETEYELKNRNIKIKPQNFNNLFINANGKPELFLRSDSANNYTPMTINENGDLHPVDEEMLYWLAMKNREAVTKWGKKSALEKYLPVVVIAVVLIGASVFYYTIGGQLQVITAQISGIADAQKGMIVEMTRLLAAAKGLPSAPAPPPF